MKKHVGGIIGLAMVLCLEAQATDGTWNQAGSGSGYTYLWATATNWVGGIIAGGTDAFAHFDAVDAVGSQYIDLGGVSQTVGRMKFTDTAPTTGFWGGQKRHVESGHVIRASRDRGQRCDPGCGH
jgi:hypothetical protein